MVATLTPQRIADDVCRRLAAKGVLPGVSVELLEFTAAAPRNVDRESGVLRGVKIIGFESKNGRSYAPDGLRQSIRLYEGARVFIDHPPAGKAAATRSLNEWVGVLENVRMGGDGLYGDLRLRKESRHFAEVLEAAEHFPKSLGLSHNAVGPVTRQGGRQVVERIETVHSVDLVSNPATAKGLYESTDPSLAGEHEEMVAKVRAATAKKILATLNGRGTPAEILAHVRQVLNQMGMQSPLAESCYRPHVQRFVNQLSRSLAPSPLIESLRRNSQADAFRESVLAIVDRSWIEHSPIDKIQNLRSLCLTSGAEPLQESVAFSATPSTYPASNPFRR